MCYDFHSIVTQIWLTAHISSSNHYWRVNFALKSFHQCQNKKHNQDTTTKQTKITSWNFLMTLNKWLLILNNCVSIIGYYLLMLDLQPCKGGKKSNWSLERSTIIFYKYRMTSCKLSYLSAVENSRRKCWIVRKVYFSKW